MTRETIKTYRNASGDRRVVFYKTSNSGTIRYEEDRYFDSAPEDEGVEIGWLNQSISGLFSRIEDAEKDAFSSIDWLRNLN